jgi:glycosyltransferase involved in cell wall biosynthesis
MAKTIIRITTVPMAFRVLLAGQPRFMREHGFHVIMISADGKELEDVKKAEDCEHILVPMTRKITPFKDLACFFQLRKIIKKYRPDIVHTHTPKAGLLGMLAAKSAGVKIRIHTVAGLPLMLETGFKKQLLLFTERLTYFAATNIWPNSKSMKAFIIEHKLAKVDKLGMISNGSTNGVDLQKFSQHTLNEATKNKMARSVPETDGLKILCVGRMVKDKGIEELLSVFEKLQKQYSLQLILVGPFEPNLDPLPATTMNIIKTNSSIVHIDWSDAVEYYMGLADIFVHPSHREGFPNVILQAGAMQLPVVCSDIPGNTDIVEDGRTGYVFKVKNETDLYARMKFAIDNKAQRQKIAGNLFNEVIKLYNRERIHEIILDNYNSLLQKYETQ